MATLDRDIQARSSFPAAWRNLLLTVHVLATVGVLGADDDRRLVDLLDVLRGRSRPNARRR
jgi:hypothetical protein